ncbi:hypothetical protein DPMN_017268 [Dreissena polymorpha]|uniref:Uncharacterized protein n=1 Tax=Dreissena polymorpha TaxID=45954 RepID=A0A9D4NG54_DREPO|nr:hypothetical protein DPMN_017268 [Dreissena polymorpha]
MLACMEFSLLYPWGLSVVEEEGWGEGGISMLRWSSWSSRLLGPDSFTFTSFSPAAVHTI